jgi:hypothetical protein
MRLSIDTTGMSPDEIRAYAGADYSLTVDESAGFLRLFYDPSPTNPAYSAPGLLTHHRVMRGWLAKIVDAVVAFTEESAAALTLVAVVEVLNDMRTLSGGDFVGKYKTPQIRVAVINRLITDLPSGMIGCPAPITFTDTPPDSATVPLTVDLSPEDLRKGCTAAELTATFPFFPHPFKTLCVRPNQIAELHIGDKPWIKVNLSTDEDYQAAVAAIAPESNARREGRL